MTTICLIGNSSAAVASQLEPKHSEANNTEKTAGKSMTVRSNLAQTAASDFKKKLDAAPHLARTLWLWLLFPWLLWHRFSDESVDAVWLCVEH